MRNIERADETENVPNNSFFYAAVNERDVHLPHKTSIPGSSFTSRKLKKLIPIEEFKRLFVQHDVHDSLKVKKQVSVQKSPDTSTTLGRIMARQAAAEQFLSVPLLDRSTLSGTGDVPKSFASDSSASNAKGFSSSMEFDGDDPAIAAAMSKYTNFDDGKSKRQGMSLSQDHSFHSKSTPLRDSILLPPIVPPIFKTKGQLSTTDQKRRSKVQSTNHVANHIAVARLCNSQRKERTPLRHSYFEVSRVQKKRHYPNNHLVNKLKGKQKDCMKALQDANRAIQNNCRWVQRNCDRAITTHKSKAFCKKWGSEALQKIFQRVSTRQILAYFRHWYDIIKLIQQAEIRDKYKQLKASHRLFSLFSNVELTKKRLAFNTWILFLGREQMLDLLRYTIKLQTRFRMKLAQKRYYERFY